MAKMKTYTYWISYDLPDEDDASFCWSEPENYAVREKTRCELKKLIARLSSGGHVYSRPRKVTHRYWDLFKLIPDVYSEGLGEPWHDVEWKLKGFWEEGFKTSELVGKV